MDAPKCKLCGERHYGICRAREEVMPHSTRELSGSVPELPEHNATPPVKAGGKASFDRATYYRDYMREYMRKRRAAAKRS